MELVTDDNCSVFLERGCKRELGRGPGIASRDKTVSHRQVSIEVQDLGAKATLEVLGLNPICILRYANKSADRNPSTEVIFLRKGEKNWLAAGDKVSLSIKKPVFFVLKEFSQARILTQAIDVTGELKSAVGSSEDALLRNWTSRKKHREDDTMNEASSSKGNREQEKEEDGIAEAIARRQRRALERQLQEGSKRKPDDIKVAQNNDPFLANAQHIDPALEFGFLEEGKEFDRYEGRPHNGKWDWKIEKKKNEGDSDLEDNDFLGRSNSKRRTGKNKRDDNWTGEVEGEKLEVLKANGSKKSKVHLRSQHQNRVSGIPSSSSAQGKKPAGVNDEKEDDDTLSGFIVSDEEDEGLSVELESEQEWSDDDDDDDIEGDEGDDVEIKNNTTRLSMAARGKKQTKQKPWCQYGKDCYRKNKEHWEEFRHPN